MILFTFCESSKGSLGAKRMYAGFDSAVGININNQI